MIVFDLDGTLSDDRWRLPFLAEGNYDKYNLSCAGDSPHLPVLSLLRALVETGRRCEIWTGRDEIARAATDIWFRTNASFALRTPAVHIRMRPKGDDRSSAELKEAWLGAVRRSGEVVELAIDDMPKCVEMWRRNGVLCLAAEWNAKDQKEYV